MKNFIKSFFTTACIASIMFLILTNTTQAKQYASLGLITWFENLVPSLLPFMILSNLLITLNLEDTFIKPIAFFLKPLFQVKDSVIYVITMGFLCGFPLGAKCCVDLYKEKKLSKNEAEYLLAFTNNISPAYFLSFVLGTILPKEAIIKGLFIQFGIPFLYGLVLRYTYFYKIIQFRENTNNCRTNTFSILKGIDRSITKSLISIAVLGGYMISFNILVLLLLYVIPNFQMRTIFHCFIEISGGFALLKSSTIPYQAKQLIIYAALSFNGLCCMFQTFHFLGETDLSKQKYMLHKIVLCSITCLVLFFK